MTIKVYKRCNHSGMNMCIWFSHSAFGIYFSHRWKIMICWTKLLSFCDRKLRLSGARWISCLIWNGTDCSYRLWSLRACSPEDVTLTGIYCNALFYKPILSCFFPLCLAMVDIKILAALTLSCISQKFDVDLLFSIIYCDYYSNLIFSLNWFRTLNWVLGQKQITIPQPSF